MCGRFALTLPSDAMAQLFEASPANDLPDVPNFNVCPTNQVHVVTAGDGGRRLVSMRWGFLPHWYKAANDGPLLINARAEKIAEKPAFRAACRERRCLIPVTGFYEWTKDEEGNRLPWYIHYDGGAPIALAGVWQEWTKGEEPLTTCAIVTTSANGPVSDIHHRMPVGKLAKGCPKPMLAPSGKSSEGPLALFQPSGFQVLPFGLTTLQFSQTSQSLGILA